MKSLTHRPQVIPDGKYREARRLRREMTDSERVLWSRLRRNQIGGLHFRRQHVIDGFIVDFYCRKVNLVVEVDGGIHNNQIEYDQIRDEIFTSQGIYILRIPNKRIEEYIDGVVEEISSLCDRLLLS
jgi:very-short-patch-repair endonuclease